MKKFLALLLFLCLVNPAFAGTITKPNTFTSGTTIVSGEVNSNFDTIYSEFNGSISNANVSGSAAIIGSKLDLSAPGAIGGTTAAAGSFSTITSDNSAASTAVAITSTSTGDSLDINHVSGDTGDAINIDYAAQPGTAVIDINQTDATGGTVIDLTNQGTGTSLLITHASGDTGDAIQIDYAATGDAIDLNHTSTGSSIAITASGVQATNKPVVLIDATGANVNADSAALKVFQNNASSSEPAIEITNDGTGAGFLVSQIGNATAVQIDSTGTGISVDLNHLSGDTGDAINIDYAADPVVAVIDINMSGNGTSLVINHTGGGSSVIMQISNTASTTSGTVLDFNNDGAGSTIEDDSGALLSAAGVWTDAPSWSWLKHKDTPLDAMKALESVSSLTISEWEYIDGKEGERHIGFMMEDWEKNFISSD